MVRLALSAAISSDTQRTPPVGAADRIYLLSEEGRTVVLGRGPQLKVLAVNSLDETFYASPAIVGNEIFLRGDKHLFCFSKTSGQ